MLSHVQNSEAGRKNWEAHVDSLFKVTFIPPAGVVNSAILTEQVIAVTGWKQPGPANIQQKFMQASRNYASTETEQTQDIAMVFELNLNDQFQNYVYNTISDWRSKVFNPLTGERGLKKNYIGTVIVESFAANGDVYWTRKLHNIWPSGDIDSIGQNEYSAADPVQLTVNFIADYYKELKR